jgi:hypothetical protein
MRHPLPPPTACHTPWLYGPGVKSLQTPRPLPSAQAAVRVDGTALPVCSLTYIAPTLTGQPLSSSWMQAAVRVDHLLVGLGHRAPLDAHRRVGSSRSSGMPSYVSYVVVYLYIYIHIYVYIYVVYVALHHLDAQG